MAFIDKINKNNTDYDLQDSKAARSVNGTTDSHVEQADEIYTTSTQVSTSAFVYRTTAGDVSIETGAASINYLEGNTVQTGHTDEVKDFQTEFASSEATAVIDWDTFDARVTALVPSYTAGTTTFVYQDALATWSYTSNYGASGTISRANLASQWGITLSGVSSEGDTITVNYVKLVIGTLTTATPTSFVATGFNQYDATAGYAHVVGNNQYRIAGTYTSLGFTTTVGGTTTAVTVTNGKFTPAEDGYIYVTGASGDILIALVWSGTMDSEPYSAYSTTSVSIPTADASSTALPTATYGMPSVGNVRDKLSFAERTYVQNIGHYTYSAANLATVQALGVAYVYDLSDIFYVLPEPVTYTLANTVSGAYTANDYGTEEFIGTTAPVNTSITYGNSLVDKLRNMLPIQSIGTGLTLTGTELSASGGGGPTVVQATGTSTTDVMSQNATTSMIFTDPATSQKVRIGRGAGVYGNCGIAIGYQADQNGNYGIALGALSRSTRKGEMAISSSGLAGNGYNNSRYRLLTGLYDGQDAHDAATVGQITPTTDSSAPTSATVGRLGQIFIDTTTATAYMCVAVDTVTPAYTWKQITA